MTLHTDLNTLKELWSKLGDVPCNDDDEIDQNFHMMKYGNGLIGNVLITFTMT